jgi:hypothetical protein
MRNNQLITSYIQAIVFVALGVRVTMAWAKDRDRRSAHLAVAGVLFGMQSLLSAISGTIWDSTKLETPPHAISVFTSILLFVAVFEFLQLLGDFITYPRWAHTISAIALGVNVAFAVIERPDIRFDPNKGIVPIAGVHNPISYKVYIGYVLLYLAVAFGVLAFAFLTYGMRTHALARFRMITIGAGFLLFCVVIGLLPRLLYGDPTAELIKNVLNILQYVALAVGPLLLLGFAPPRLIRSRFGGGGQVRHA